MGRSPADRFNDGQTSASKQRAAVDLLLRAGSALAESLEADVILERVATLVVPTLADWCVIDLAGETGIRRSHVAHVDPAKVAWAFELHERYPPDPQAPMGAPNVMRTGEAEIYHEITDELLRAAARDDEHYRLSRDVGMTSAMVVPMVARGKVLGAITMVAAESGRRYDREDLSVARALATRAALAVENARLFLEVREGGLRYSTLLETVEGIVWEADPQTLAFTFVSRQAERMLGYPIERWLESDFLDRILHPGDRERALAHLRGASRDSGGTHEELFRVYREDGTSLWLRDIVHRDTNARGGPLRGLMVDVTERKSFERRLRAHLAATRSLADYASLTDAARNLLREVCEALEWDVAALWHVDADAGVLRCVDVWSAPGTAVRFAAVTRSSVFPPGIGLPGRVWSSGRPHWVGDVATDPNFPRASVAEADGLHGALGFPVIGRGAVVGVIEFFSRWIEEPDAELLQMSETVGLEVGLFFERRWAEEEIRFQKALLESQSETTIDGVIVVAPDGITILSANRRFAELWGIDEKLLEPGRSAAALGDVFEQFENPDEIARETLEIFRDPNATQRREVRLSDGRIFDRYTAPLFSADGHNYGRAWYFRDVSDRVRAQQLLAAAKERTEFLAEASAVFAGSLDAHAIMSSLARLAVPYLADLCMVDTVDDAGRIRRVAVTHADPGAGETAAALSKHTDFPADEAGCVGRVLAGGQAEMIGATHDPQALAGSDPAYVSLVAGLEVASYICVPLVARGRTFGAITFIVVQKSGRRYDRGDLALAEDLAARAALAVDNARLYAEQAHIARVLQTSLLPPDLPRIPGIELAASYHAAGEGNEVGGDFYDVFHTGAQDWAVVIGDVCGKGADAASLTALIRYTVRAAAMQAQRPKRVLGILNEAVLRQRHEREFCTIAYVRVRTGEGRARVTLCCGGHPMPYFVRADGTVEPAAKPGTLMGIFDQPDLSDVDSEMGPGDALVLYTDGVTEARAADGTIGEHLLPTLLREVSGLPARQIAARIEKAVLDFQAGKPRDDVAVVVLRVEQPEEAGRQI